MKAEGLGYDIMLNDLTKRRYPHILLKNTLPRATQPNTRQVHFLKLVLPHSCYNQCIDDLKPFNEPNASEQKKKGYYFAAILRKFLKLDEIPYEHAYENCTNVDHHWVNMIPIGKKTEGDYLEIWLLAETRQIWFDKFVSDLENRRYGYVKDGKAANASPIVKEIKLFDISIPDETMPRLLDDLEVRKKPIFGKNFDKVISWMFRKGLNLKKINYIPKKSGEVNTNFVTILPIGTKSDNYSKDRGELI